MKRKIGGVVLAILLVGLLLLGCGPSAKEKELEAQVAESEAQETELEAQIAELQDKLNVKEALISRLEAQISELESEVEEREELEAQLARWRSEISTKDGQISQLKDQKADLEQEAADAKTELAAILAKEPKDPTYAGLQEFLKQDKTDQAKFGSVYEEYCRLFLKNAREAGIRCYLVVVLLKSYFSGFVIGVQTTDRGLIYIGAADDEEVRLEIGKKWHELNNQPPYWFDDTITNITVFDFD